MALGLDFQSFFVVIASESKYRYRWFHLDPYKIKIKGIRYLYYHVRSNQLISPFKHFNHRTTIQTIPIKMVFLVLLVHWIADLLTCHDTKIIQAP